MAIDLEAFLADPRRPAGTLTFHELQGFLFAVASAPELVAPSEWMPQIFGDQGAPYETLEEAQNVIVELMGLYNVINATVTADLVALPSDCAFRPDALANLDDDAPVAQWSRGFLGGHQWLEESWDPFIPEELDDEYGGLLMTLSFFASRDLAEAYCAEARGPSLQETAEAIVGVFEAAMGEYAHLGRRVLDASTEASPIVRQEKIGRNLPCPCGSGRKYKKCCGASQ